MNVRYFTPGLYSGSKRVSTLPLSVVLDFYPILLLSEREREFRQFHLSVFQSLVG